MKRTLIPRDFEYFCDKYQITPMEVKLMQGKLTANLMEREENSNLNEGFITLRIILPDRLHSCHLDCYIETVLKNTTFGELKSEWARIYGWQGDWVLERGVLLLDASCYDRTLEDIGILNGDTLSTPIKENQLFLINYYVN